MVVVNLAEVVPESQLAILAGYQVAGLQRHLAAPAGQVDDVGGDGQAGGMPAHALDDAQAFFHGGAQVFGALHLVGLEEIVRADFSFERGRGKA